MGKSKHKASKRKFLVVCMLTLIGVALLYREWNKPRPSRSVFTLDELPAGFNSYGIDVSHHQGEINWDTFFSSNDSLIAFVYCKSTEGVKYIDTQWKRNRSILVKRGIANGAYHFFLPNKDPIAQAEHFLDNYTWLDNDLPPVLDVETEGETTKSLVENILQWLIHVENTTGKRPVIYTSHHMYKTLLKSHFDGYKFWIANYNSTVNGLEDDNIIHWQYSENGVLQGIKNKVDLNYSKIEF